MTHEFVAVARVVGLLYNWLAHGNYFLQSTGRLLSESTECDAATDSLSMRAVPNPQGKGAAKHWGFYLVAGKQANQKSVHARRRRGGPA